MQENNFLLIIRRNPIKNYEFVHEFDTRLETWISRMKTSKVKYLSRIFIDISYSLWYIGRKVLEIGGNLLIQTLINEKEKRK